MYFLTPPDLAASKESWEAWILELKKLPQRDESVKFAMKLATRHLEQQLEFEEKV